MNALSRKVLIVEDNPKDVDWFQQTFALDPRWQWSLSSDLESALLHLDQNNVDLIVLDLSLPDCRGLDTLQHIKDRAPGSPVVVCSISEDESLALQAIEAGAQDYLMKNHRDPGHFLRSLQFAFSRHNRSNPNFLDLSEDCRLNLIAQNLEVWSDEKNNYDKLPLTPFEFRLLAFFGQNPGKTLSRANILQELRGEDSTSYTERTIDVHISTLKHKYPFMKELLRSIYGIGYVFGKQFGKSV